MERAVVCIVCVSSIFVQDLYNNSFVCCRCAWLGPDFPCCHHLTDTTSCSFASSATFPYTFQRGRVGCLEITETGSRCVVSLHLRRNFVALQWGWTFQLVAAAVAGSSEIPSTVECQIGMVGLQDKFGRLPNRCCSRLHGRLCLSLSPYYQQLCQLWRNKWMSGWKVEAIGVEEKFHSLSLASYIAPLVATSNHQKQCRANFQVDCWYMWFSTVASTIAVSQSCICARLPIERLSRRKRWPTTQIPAESAGDRIRLDCIDHNWITRLARMI